MEVKKKTTYFDFLVEPNKLELSLMRKPSLQGNFKHKSIRLSNQENPHKKERLSAKYQNKGLS